MRKASRLVLGTMCLLLVVSGCRSKSKVLGIHFDIQHEKLGNGLNILMIKDETVPLVSYQTWFRVGSVDETPGKSGMAHLFEHLMFKGSEKYGPKAFFDTLESRGAQVNAFTTRDYTSYYQTFTPDLLDQVIDLEADRMTSLRLNSETLKSEQQVVLEERRLRTENTPVGKMNEALWQLAYSVHPYRWPVIGFPQDVLSVTVSDLHAFFKKYYAPSNAVVIVTGNFDPKLTLEKIEKAYGKIPERPRPSRSVPTEPQQNGEKRLTLYDEVVSDRFTHAYRITSIQEEDSFSLDVLAQILFDGVSSRAHQALVEKSKVALGVSGNSYTPTYPGLFTISTVMRNGRSAEEGEKSLDLLLKDIQAIGVTEAEVKKAVKQLTVRMMDQVRTAYGKGKLLGVVMSVLEDPERYAEDLEKYLKVQPKDVQRVAKKYLRPNSRSVVIMKPRSEKK